MSARYTDRMAYPSLGDAARAMFSVARVSGGAGLADNLDVLLTALPPRTTLSADRIVYDHTLLPFYVPFLETEQFVALRTGMNSELTARTANGVHYITKHLRIATLTVAQRHAFRLGLQIQRNGQEGTTIELPSSRRLEASPHFHELREQKRYIWLQALEQAPDATVTELRKRVNGAYVWLRRYDPEWTDEHLPRHQYRPAQTQNEQEWKMQDAAYAERVRQSASSMSMVDGRPRKVTRSGLHSHTHIWWLQSPQQLADYPLTRAAMAEVVETRESFAARKAKWEREQTKL